MVSDFNVIVGKALAKPLILSVTNILSELFFGFFFPSLNSCPSRIHIGGKNAIEIWSISGISGFYLTSMSSLIFWYEPLFPMGHLLTVVLRG